MTRPQELLSAKQIQGRIGQIARDIERHYRDEPFVLLGVLKGSVIFLADLMREIRAPFDLEFLAARSYGEGTTPEGPPVLAPFEAESLADRHVLLVDDILDTGGTLVRVREWLLDQGALSVRTCVLLDKPARREHDIKPDFFGFQIPDLFVVGYGMDHAGTWRQLPYIGRLPETA